MKVKFYGTRGSIPIAAPHTARYGGNTTCLRIESTCLPEGAWLVVDAGSGMVPLSWDYRDNGGTSLTLLLSHFHHDHTCGFPMTHFPYDRKIPVDVYGPHDHGIGPRQVFQTLMHPPFFPVDYQEVAGHIHCHDIPYPTSTALVMHPSFGTLMMTVEAFERCAEERRVAYGAQRAVDLRECMVVRMYRSNHPEQTIAFRFEELPTGRVFVFVTDHENEAGLPTRFRAHLEGADLLVMDCQYTREKYDRFTAGYGHATPDYVAWVTREVGVGRLGITHHDPPASDDDIDGIVASLQALLPGVEVFGCRDYMDVAVEPARPASTSAP